jgi:hypothetical protein
MRQERMAARRARGPADSWEDRSLSERCVVYHGVPPLPTAYNNNYQIVQTKEYVAILTEMIHEVRIIPLDGRPHLPSDVRFWLGDSRGHWEGNTLVVDTVGLTDRTVIDEVGMPHSDELHVIERYTRTDANTLEIVVTIDDPKTFTQKWDAKTFYKRARSDQHFIEYICENNRSARE